MIHEEYSGVPYNDKGESFLWVAHEQLASTAAGIRLLNFVSANGSVFVHEASIVSPRGATSIVAGETYAPDSEAITFCPQSATYDLIIDLDPGRFKQVTNKQWWGFSGTWLEGSTYAHELGHAEVLLELREAIWWNGRNVLFKDPTQAQNLLRYIDFAACQEEAEVHEELRPGQAVPPCSHLDQLP